MAFDLEDIYEEFAASTGGRREYLQDGYSFGRVARTSQAEKARERVWIRYQGVVAKRQAQQVVATCSCGETISRSAQRRGPKARWCSMRCYHRDYQRVKNGVRAICAGCGVEFEPPKFKRGPPSAYCSRPCGNRHRVRLAAKAKRQAAAPPPEDAPEHLDARYGSPFAPLDSDDIDYLIETGRVWIPPSLQRAA